MKRNLKKYVKNSLSQEFRKIINSPRKNYNNELDNFEKAIIYHYTDDGYESLNENLRNGNDISDFGQYLNYSLKKLPDYKLLCYRTIKCSKSKLKRYYDAFKDDLTIIEKSFLSCSKSRMLSLYFSESPLFIIKSKKGKDIEKIAKFGIDSGENEKEILFSSNSKFKVLDIREENDKIIITLEEI